VGLGEENAGCPTLIKVCSLGIDLCVVCVSTLLDLPDTLVWGVYFIDK